MLCTLYGYIEDTQLKQLVERLKGLCNALTFDYTFNLNIHELVYIPIVETPFGPDRNRDIVLKLNASFIVEKEFVKLKHRKWQLSHYGPPEIEKQDQKQCNHRTTYDSEIVGDPFLYLRLLGYKPSFEYVKQGYTFTFNKIQIDIYRIAKEFKVSSMIEEQGAWIVEASQYASPEMVHLASDELYKLSGYLNGIVSLERVDHALLQVKINYEAN